MIYLCVHDFFTDYVTYDLLLWTSGGGQDVHFIEVNYNLLVPVREREEW